MDTPAIQGTDFLGSLGLAPNKHANEVSKLGADSSFFGRLQWIPSSEDDSIIPNNFYFLNGDEKENLGKTLDVLAIDWLPMVLVTKPIDGFVKGTSLHTPALPEFETLQDLAELKNPNVMAGATFLVYIPKVKKYATFFFGTRTMRNHIGRATGKVGSTWEVFAEKITTNPNAKGETFTYRSANFKDAATPFIVSDDLRPEMIEQINSFRDLEEKAIKKLREREASQGAQDESPQAER